MWASSETPKNVRRSGSCQSWTIREKTSPLPLASFQFFPQPKFEVRLVFGFGNGQLILTTTHKCCPCDSNRTPATTHTRTLTTRTHPYSTVIFCSRLGCKVVPFLPPQLSAAAVVSWVICLMCKLVCYPQPRSPVGFKEATARQLSRFSVCTPVQADRYTNRETNALAAYFFGVD